MANTTYEVHGGRDIQATLENVKSAIANRIVNQAMMKQGSRANKIAKSRCIHKKLRNAIGVIRRAAKKRGNPGTVVIGPRKGFDYVTGFGEKRNPARYGRIVENGRRDVTLTHAMFNKYTGQVFGRSIKAVSPRPFMLPAFAYVQGAGKAEIASDIESGLAAAVVKYRAKGKSIHAN